MRKTAVSVSKGKKPTGSNTLPAFCVAFLILLLACGCADGTRQDSSTHFMMDTIVQIDVYGKEQSKNQKAIKQAFQVMQRIAEKTDRYGQGELSYVNKNAGIKPGEVSRDLLIMAGFAKLQQNSEVDITVGPLVDVWNAAREQKILPDREQIAAALDKTGMGKLLVDKEKGTLYLLESGMSLDFGAIAKGYAVEQAGQFLSKDKDIVCALVNGGGNIKVVGSKPDNKAWRIGIQDPRALSDNIGVLNLKAGEAVATSGDYQRYYEVDGKRYHHLLQPKTGYPAAFNISVTAVTNDAFLADYYSTMLFLMPTQQALTFVEQTKDLHAIIIGSDEKIYISSDLKDSFEKNEKLAWLFN